MSKKTSTIKPTSSDSNTHDYDQYRKKNITLGDRTSKSTDKRHTSGTGPRDKKE